MQPGEKRYAEYLAKKTTESKFDIAAVAIMANADPANPKARVRDLFRAGAFAGAAAAIRNLNSEVDEANDVIAKLSLDLEVALVEALENDLPQSVIDPLLQARNRVASYSGALWSGFWQEQEERVAELLGVKPHALNEKHEIDYVAMAESLLQIGREKEVHSFYVWYVEPTETIDADTFFLKSHKFSANQLRNAVQRFENDTSGKQAVIDYMRTVRKSWGVWKDVISRNAAAYPMPTMQMSYEIAKELFPSVLKDED